MAKKSKSELAQIAAETAQRKQNHIDRLNSFQPLNLVMQRMNCNTYGNPRVAIRILVDGPDGWLLATVFDGLTRHKVSEKQVTVTSWKDPKQIAEDFEAELKANGVTALIKWFATSAL